MRAFHAACLWAALAPACARACPQVPARCADYAEAFQAVAAHHRLPVELFVAVATVESQCSPTALSPVGAIGVMQLLPETFDRVSRVTGTVDAWDPTQSIVAGGHYLAALIFAFDGWWGLGIAAYNTGPGRVPDRVPAATWAYVGRVLELYECQGGTPPVHPEGDLE